MQSQPALDRYFFDQGKPAVIPPLDPSFIPAVLVNRAFANQASQVGVPLVFGLERENGHLSRFESAVFAGDDPRSAANFAYAERLLKFLLWQRGGFRVYVGGPRDIGEYLQSCYATGGARQFDAHFMGHLVHERPFEVIPCAIEEVPAEMEVGTSLGRHLDGCRIGFDLGASDRKVSAVIDGRWFTAKKSSGSRASMLTPSTTIGEIRHGAEDCCFQNAACRCYWRQFGRDLYRQPPNGGFAFPRHPARALRRDQISVPAPATGAQRAVGSDQRWRCHRPGRLDVAGRQRRLGNCDGLQPGGRICGYQGRIRGWLNELCFAPIDYTPSAPVDEWSGDIGCGSQYFSQQCVFRLAPQAGIQIPTELTDAEKLNLSRKSWTAGHEGAVKIWQSMGIYLGYALAHYADFYDIKHVLILGRCTSGLGGKLILDGARRVLAVEFPELARASPGAAPR